MPDMKEYFKNIKESYQKLDKIMLEAYENTQQTCDKVNAYIEQQKNLQQSMQIENQVSVNDSSQTNADMEQMLNNNTKEMINSYDTGKIIESSMNNFDIDQINQEAINEAEQESEYKEDSLDAEQLVIDSQRHLTSQMMSIKKASVKNKRKKKEIDLKMVPYVAAVAAACLAFGITVTAPLVANAINNYYPNKMRKEALNHYEETILEPNKVLTMINIGEPHLENKPQWKTIVEQEYQEHENPIVGFYLIYTKLSDEEKNNEFSSILDEFNKKYGTDYKSLEDLFVKNNMKSFKDLEEYVGYELSRLDGGRNL